MPPTAGLCRGLALSLVAALAVIAPIPLSALPDGDFDLDFYTDGKYVFPQQAINFDHELLAVAEAPDGRLVVAGVRETPLGTSTLFWTVLDGVTAPTTCFAFTAIEPPVLARANAVAFDAAGRLLVGGRADFIGEIDVEGIVLRFLYPACDLDESFGGDGVVRTDFAAEAEVHAISVDAEQRVLAAGTVGGIGGTGFVLRLDGTGIPDPTFDGDGRRELPETPLAMDLQDDGKIVLAARPSGGETIRVVRLDTLGDLDGTFSGDGRVDLDFRETEMPAGIRFDRHRPGIVVAGNANTDVTTETSLARLMLNGAPDPAFDDDGLWVGYCTGTSEVPRGLALQSDGRILVAGLTFPISPFVCRRLPDGSPDTAFQGDGSATLPFHSEADGDSSAADIAVLSSGRIALAGYAFDSNPMSGAAARLENSHIFSDGFDRGSTASWSNDLP